MKILNWIKENKALVLLLLIGSVLRLYKLDFQSVWIDEICSFNEADPKMTVVEIYNFVKAFDQHPPFYYTSLHFIFIIFGHTTFVMRAYSALLGIAGLFAFYFLGKEIANKKVALLSVLLLTFNFFHIYYSQEARMYSLLFLTTTLSFYGLVRFIKKQTAKTTFVYILCTTLMIYSHFLALFVLISQVLIMLYFLFEQEKENRKKFFLLSAVSGLAVFILWIPAFKIFLAASGTKLTWIPLPTSDVFYSLFKEFFGNTDTIFFFAYVLIIFYLFKTFNTAEKEKKYKSDKNLSQFVIICTWIFVPLLLAFSISYLKTPVMVSRYFMSLLPAILLLTALGLSKIRNTKLRGVVIVFFVISSMADLIAVKDYYNKITKTQFREITDDLISKNESKDVVVSPWAWHLNSFLNKHKINTFESDLQQYVNNLTLDPSKKVDFWYLGAHFQQYQLSPDAEAFLNSNFTQIEKLEYYDTWARHYVLKAGVENTYVLKISEFEPIKTDNDLNILLFSNSTTKSKPIELEPGNYRLTIKGKSLPEKPLNNENAHLTISINQKKIDAYFLSEKEETLNFTSFKIDKKQNYQIDITFDNDLVLDTADRNALIFSVLIEKVTK